MALMVGKQAEKVSFRVDKMAKASRIRREARELGLIAPGSYWTAPVAVLAKKTGG